MPPAHQAQHRFATTLDWFGMPNDSPNNGANSIKNIPSAHVIGGRLLGGAELFYARLVNALHQRGHATLAITHPHSLILDTLHPDISRAPVPMRGIWDLWSRWQIRQAVQQYRPEIVQTYMGRATRLAHFPKQKHCIHVARLGGYYNLTGYRHAHAWIGNTQGICDYLIHNGLPAQRVFKIGNFILPHQPSSPEILSLRRQQLGVPNHALLIVAVGRLHPVKGFEDLITAFSALPTTLAEQPIYLAIVGDGPLNQPLKHLCRELGLADRVCWTGWQRDSGLFQELADLIVCPSRHEPLGNVILEAWAWRRPVLATRAVGPAEIAIHQEDAWLVPVNDPAALAKSMRILLTDVSLRDHLAANGFRKVHTFYSEQTIVSAYLDLYRHLLGR